MKKNICIDIDGTMSDPYFFIPYLNELTGKNLTKEDYTSIHWNDTYGPEFQDIYENFDEEYTYIYNEVELQEGVKEVIDLLLARGKEVYFVTARSQKIDKITRAWLESKGIDSSKVYSLSGNEEKVITAQKLNCDFFIEDNPSNIKNLYEAGFNVIAMESNYNRKHLSKLKEDIAKDFEKRKNSLEVVQNWEDIREILLEK